jgi:hypothetical protein
MGDRCDTCSAQAVFEVMKDGFDILFCRHHYIKNSAKLTEQGFHVTVDETEKLTPNKLVGSEN